MGDKIESRRRLLNNTDANEFISNMHLYFAKLGNYQLFRDAVIANS